jgi:hypothetical protein
MLCPSRYATKKLKLHTALGKSITSYQNSTSLPIHGTGKGSCASPTIWLMVSSLLMTILQQRAHGMHMCDVEKHRKTLIQFIKAFVDDTGLFTNEENNNINELRKKMKT